MTDRELLNDLIEKLREIEEQLSMAQLETTAQSLLASRIRHLSILALYVRGGLERIKDADPLPPATGDKNLHRGAKSGG